MSSEERQQTVVRLRRSLWRRAKVEALDRGVSFNALVEVALEKELEPASSRAPEVEAVRALADAQAPTAKPEVKEKEPSVPRTTRSSPRTSPPSGQSSDTIPKIARKHWA